MSSKGSDGDGSRAVVRRSLVMSEIYAQAARLFAQRGFAGTSLQDIADATGFSRQALYHYVKSKNELFEQLVTDITRSPAAELHAINSRDDLDARGKLHAIAKALATHRAEHPDSFLLAVRSEANFPEELSNRHREGKRAVLNEIVRVVDAGQRAGEFRQVDATIAALSILGMLNWVAWWYNPEGRESAESIGQQIAELAVAVVACPPDEGATASDPGTAFAVLRGNLDTLEHAVKSALASAPPPGHGTNGRNPRPHT